jgi:hypothetical protein
LKPIKTFISIAMCVILAMGVTFGVIRGIQEYGSGTARTADIVGNGNQALKDTASGGKEFEKTVEGLKFEIKMDKETYTINDKIKINVKVTNVTDKTIIYNTPSSTKDYFYIGAGIQAPKYDSSFIYIPKPGETGGFDAAIGVHELKAGEFLEDSFTFIPKVHLNGNELAVSAGEYSAQISVILDDYNPVRVTVPVVVGEGREQITKDQAQNIAEGHKDIKDWLDARSPEALTKIEDGQYYILEAHGWQAVSKELYDDVFRLGAYQVGVEYQEGYWNVIYMSKLGSAPNRIEVKVDLKTGEIKAVESKDK